jgi:Ca2+-binding RTX toxin-like protein
MRNGLCFVKYTIAWSGLLIYDFDDNDPVVDGFDILNAGSADVLYRGVDPDNPTGISFIGNASTLNVFGSYSVDGQTPWNGNWSNLWTVGEILVNDSSFLSINVVIRLVYYTYDTQSQTYGASNVAYSINLNISNIPLFSDFRDTVDFNALTSLQNQLVTNIATVNGIPAVYSAGDDDDRVTLPNTGNYLLPGGHTWDPSITFLAGAGDDTVQGGNGNDRFFGGSGDDVLYGMAGNDQISGTEGDDIINGGAGQDTLTGGSGADVFIVGAHGDSTNGAPDLITDFQAGIDRLDFSAVGGTGYLIGDSGGDKTVTVSTPNGPVTVMVQGNITVYDLDLGSIPVTVNGSPGNDTMRGGTAGDTLYGGTGDDTYIINSVNDVAIENPGEGIDELLVSVTYTMPNEVENGTIVGVAATSLSGNGGNNHLIGNDSVNTLDGGGGNDWIEGRGANDTLIGGSGADQLEGEGGDDLLQGGDDNDVLDGGDGTDTLEGGAGDDQFYETGIVTSGGGDTFVGGTGNDTYYVSGYQTVVELENEGIDSAIVNSTYFLPENVENATLVNGAVYANGEGDDLYGNIQSNVLIGDAAGNRFESRAGADRLTGGLGADYFAFFTDDVRTTTNLAGARNAPYDVITDFDVGIDTLYLQLNASSWRVEYLQREGQLSTVILASNDDFQTAFSLVLLGRVASPQDLELNIYGSLAIVGSAASENLAGFDHTANTIVGNAGHDTIQGGASADTFTGGSGNDTFVFAKPNDSTPVFRDTITDFNTGIDTIDLSAMRIGNLDFTQQGSYILNTTADGQDFVLEIFGTVAASDFVLGARALVGTAGADTLIASNLDDTLDGQGEADQLYGLSGNDSYRVDTQLDVVFENLGEGTDLVTSSADFYLYANIENLILESGAGDIFGVGNDLANLLTGNEGANLLLGGQGDDTLSGGAGNDIVYGEGGADTLSGGEGIDYLIAGTGNDDLDGGDGADALYGEDGDDILVGGASFDTDILVGGAGNDILDGIGNQSDPEYDLMDGGDGNDTYWIDTGDDLTFEAVGGGNDTVHADILVPNAGAYLYANVENLVLEGTTAFGVGNELANMLTGSASGNWLLGGAGNDRITGAAGNDVLFGEGGADTFVFGAGSGQDVIGDFAVAQDVIEFAAYFTSFAQVQTNMIQVGNDGAINLGNGELIVLHGVTMASLTAANFTFVSAATPTASMAVPALELSSFRLAADDSFADHGLIRWQAEIGQAVFA